jgi:hypothetical protein
MRRGQREANSNHLGPRRRRQSLSALVTGKIVAIVASTVFAGQAWSEEGARAFVFSTGTKSCGEYLRAAEAERKARPAHPEPNGIYSMDYLDFASYADGFLTGPISRRRIW